MIEQLGLGQVVAVGHSSGGMAVLQLAASHPDRVAAIVMVDPAPFVFRPERRAALEAMVTAIEAGNQEPFLVITRGDEWIETTLLRPGEELVLVEGQVANIVSWSGAHDKIVSYMKERPHR